MFFETMQYQKCFNTNSKFGIQYKLQRLDYANTGKKTKARDVFENFQKFIVIAFYNVS